MTGNGGREDDGRVRKRASNACIRCRRQKIKCSGNIPCDQCVRRSAQCIVNDRRDKIYVSQSYVAELERRAARLSSSDVRPQTAPEAGRNQAHNFIEDSGFDGAIQPLSPSVASNNNDETESHHESGLRATPEAGLTNPLDPSNSESFTVSTSSRHYYMGVSSNWSFGRRVVAMVHEHVSPEPLPSDNLLFPGTTYDLYWDGQRNPDAFDTSNIPTADFALFQINAVKFHCGRLFHLFDESVFMHHFDRFYENSRDARRCPRLWYVHFLLLLAFGKAFIARASKGKRPPGVELFVQAMQLLPDITQLYGDPIQSIEILCCAALYLQCIDLRSAGYNVIGQAVRIAVEQGMHTDLQSRHLSSGMVERCRETWWTVYVLDRQMTSTLGAPMSISDDDITAPLPNFAGSISKASALRLLVKLSQATAVIVQTVYGKTGRRGDRFLASIKDALKTLAEANDERISLFPLDLEKPATGVDRLTAYLHLLHHLSLILATRPLLYSFLQMRLKSGRSLRVSSTHGARFMIRVCVKSAQQCLSILEALQSQSLLESFIPYDRDATFVSAMVLTIAGAVDRSLLRTGGPRNETVNSILDEMASRGNLLADYHRRELDLLRADIQQIQENESLFTTPVSTDLAARDDNRYSTRSSGDLLNVDDQMLDPFENFGAFLNGWDPDEELNGEHLMAVADSLDLGQLDWLANAASQPLAENSFATF